MKKVYTLLLAALAWSASDAQLKPGTTSPPDKTPAIFSPALGRIVHAPEKTTKPKPGWMIPGSEKVLAVEEYTGTTIYDLMTNNSVQNRIVAAPNGVAVTFTYSGTSANGTFPDRGTGYNYRTDGEWGPEPSERLEDVRTGWPSLVHLADGKEIIFNHSGTGGIRQWSRPVVGSGNWTGTTVPTSTDRDMFWPRAAAGGSDGNTIHLIALTEPTGAGGTEYEGLNGALLYYRSTDGGTTWDIQDLLLPGIDSLNLVGISADQYAISVREDKVAIGIFGEFYDVMLLTSDDNGETWTNSTVWNYPIDLYEIDDGMDVESDGIQDTIFFCDGTGAVLIDDDDHVHLAFGTMFYTDELNTVDSVYTFFPLNGGVFYWNDTFASEDDIFEIGYAPDNSANDPAGITEVGEYGNSGVASHPQLATDDDGNLYCSYQAVNDLFYTGTEYFRHIFAVKSEDGGVSWSAQPNDITPDLDEDGWEYVYASMYPRLVNDKLHLIVMRDDEPGIFVQPEDAADPVTDNDQIYVCITSDLVSVEELSHSEPTMLIYPNPGNGQIQVQGAFEKGDLILVQDITGKMVYQSNTTSDEFWQADLSALGAGVYSLTIVAEGASLTSRMIIQE